MINAELIAKIKAEIKRRRDSYLKMHSKYGRDADYIAATEDLRLLEFLDTLESEKPMNLDEEYEKKIKRILSIAFIHYLDFNRPMGKMNLSNGECKDIDNAFDTQDWGKLCRYADKMLNNDAVQKIQGTTPCPNPTEESEYDFSEPKNVVVKIDYAKNQRIINREEAIQILETQFPHDSVIREALATVIPEFRERIESEKPIEGLENEAVSYCFDNGLNLSPKVATDFAHHFAKWGAEHLKK